MAIKDLEEDLGLGDQQCQDQKREKANSLSKSATKLNDNDTKSHQPKHTVYSVSEKYILVLLASGVAIWSSCGSPIYYPALQILEKQFNISEEVVNVSVVVYLLCQGIAPTFVAPFADKYGRRPILLACLLVFIGASIGLAVSNSYGLILGLRCLQSIGISPAVAVSCGITGDWTQRHERGWFVGLTSGFTLLGQAFGPLVGAALIARFSWRAIFWFMAIGGGFTLLTIAILLPETKRHIVGNGSISPRHLIARAPLLKVPYYQHKWDLVNPDYSTLVPKAETDFFASLKILLKPELAICLLNGAIHFSLWTSQLTSLTTELSKSYGYSVMKIGLCYLPSGIGGLFGSFMSGRIMDIVYRKLLAKFETKRKAGLTLEGERLNIVKARVLVAIPYCLVTDGFAVMYGWCLQKHINISTILVSSFFISNGSMSVIGINSTLLIDLYPSNSSAATSSVNLTRCLCAAIFVASLTSMNESLTIGGTFTLLAALGATSAFLLFVPMNFGMKWIHKREIKKKFREKESAQNSYIPKVID